MQRLPEIKAAYDRLADLLEDRIAAAVRAGDQATETKLVEAQRMLD